MLNINTIHTYLQIVQNSREPLEVIREAIANAYDNLATEVEITINYIIEDNSINITIKDNGTGISIGDIEKYIFGLGFSTKKNGDENIGNKGVGTLLYLKSRLVSVTSFKNGKGAKQQWIEPYKSLIKFNESNHIKDNNISIKPPQKIPYTGQSNGTTIEIKGFLQNNPLTFHHDKLKDFIHWFTKIGSFEAQLKSNCIRQLHVKIKGLEFTEHNNASLITHPYDTGKGTFIDKNEIRTREKFEILDLGFSFPAVSNKMELINNPILLECNEDNIIKEIKKLLVLKFTSEDITQENQLDIIYTDSLGNLHETNVEYVVYRIGETVRNNHNHMIKRQSNFLPSYKYTVGERYGIYLAKDFIPVQQINTSIQSIGGGGNGRLQYLGFFNCQSIDLTIDRTGAATINEDLQIKLLTKINNIMSNINKKVNEEIDKLYNEVIQLRTELNTNIDSNSILDPDENQNLVENPNGEENVEQVDNNTEADNGVDNNDSDNNNLGDTGHNLTTTAEQQEIANKNAKKAQRIHKIKLKKSLTVTTPSGNVVLREPNNESELYGILVQIVTLRPDLFDFSILDYNTSNGIDILARDKSESENDFNNLFHIELKEKLTTTINHLLQDVKYIFCWRIDDSLRSNLILKDKYQHQYRLDSENGNYILIRENPIKKVRVIELKDIVEKTFGQLNVISQ